MVSMDDYDSAKGYIVIFTCNTCPYSKAYESRISDLHEKYASGGFPVLAVNPNDPEVSGGDSYEAMKERAAARSEEHTSELQSLMRISYAVFCLQKKTNE